MKTKSTQARAERGDLYWREGSKLEDCGRIAEAVKVYRRGARLGDTSAMLNLANLLDDYARPRRPREAVYWYKRAIKLGHYTGAYNLAMHYRNLGQQRWFVHWMLVAARMGDPSARPIVRRLGK